MRRYQTSSAWEEISTKTKGCERHLKSSEFIGFACAVICKHYLGVFLPNTLTEKLLKINLVEWRESELRESHQQPLVYRAPRVLNGVVYVGQWNTLIEAPEGRGIWISVDRVYAGYLEEVKLALELQDDYDTCIVDAQTVLVHADGSVFQGVSFQEPLSIQLGTLTTAANVVHKGQFDYGTTNMHGVIKTRQVDGKVEFWRYFQGTREESITEEIFEKYFSQKDLKQLND